jgi:hypothetical protein
MRVDYETRRAEQAGVAAPQEQRAAQTAPVQAEAPGRGGIAVRVGSRAWTLKLGCTRVDDETSRAERESEGSAGSATGAARSTKKRNSNPKPEGWNAQLGCRRVDCSLGCMRVGYETRRAEFSTRSQARLTMRPPSCLRRHPRRSAAALPSRAGASRVLDLRPRADSRWAPRRALRGLKTYVWVCKFATSGRQVQRRHRGKCAPLLQARPGGLAHYDGPKAPKSLEGAHVDQPEGSPCSCWNCCRRPHVAG